MNSSASSETTEEVKPTELVQETTDLECTNTENVEPKMHSENEESDDEEEDEDEMVHSDEENLDQIKMGSSLLTTITNANNDYYDKTVRVSTSFILLNFHFF